MRILKGWPENERKELEEAKDNGFDSAMYLINRIVDYADDCTSLTKKYINGSSDENNQLARDIADYYAGVAKFPEQKYVVHDKVTGQYIYYNVTGWSLCWGRFDVTIPDLGIPETKTKEEWLAINLAYEPMLERAEDDEWQRSK